MAILVRSIGQRDQPRALLVVLIALLLAAVLAGTLLAGGTKTGVALLVVLPVVLAAATLGTRLGLLTAAISGVGVAFLPFDTLINEPQMTTRWVLRLVVLVSVAFLVGFVRSRLMDLAAARSRFISTVSHELRTPLTSVVGFSESLHERREELADWSSEMVGYIRRDAFQLSHVLDQMVLAARLDATKLPVEADLIGIREILVQVIENLPPIGSSLNIDVVGDATAVADRLRLRQIVRNLLVHAALANGGSTEIRISSGTESALVELTHDGGQLDDSEQHLFAPFYELKPSTVQPITRSLSLTVSRQLARLTQTFHGLSGCWLAKDAETPFWWGKLGLKT